MQKFKEVRHEMLVWALILWCAQGRSIMILISTKIEFHPASFYDTISNCAYNGAFGVFKNMVKVTNLWQNPAEGEFFKMIFLQFESLHKVSDIYCV